MDLKDLPEIGKILPGAFGSLFSMLMVKDSIPKMFITFLGGVAVAYYATPYTVKVTQFDPGLAGFLLGFFGMAVIISFFEGWKKLDITTLLRDFLRIPSKPENPK